MNDEIPIWIEADLDMLGVRKPKPENPLSSSKPADHEPWKPSKPNEQPPF